MVIAVYEDPRLHREQFGNLAELFADGGCITLTYRRSLLRCDPLFDEVIELPHQQRHAEAPMECDALRIGRRRRFHLHTHEHIDGLPLAGFELRYCGMGTGL